MTMSDDRRDMFLGIGIASGVFVSFLIVSILIWKYAWYRYLSNKVNIYVDKNLQQAQDVIDMKRIKKNLKNQT